MKVFTTVNNLIYEWRSTLFKKSFQKIIKKIKMNSKTSNNNKRMLITLK